ncbi:glycosyltransferase family 2 protein [Pseudoclavibacter terrae]|uniref:Glycosyltransferase n=1 Tax=Pseudoclavibacter terrae TaxID=1530195 RepID=A0A7J5B694_9MICO|nr:glycosyltransferase family 2 protein [Pseudoclavibacter terrae]KAB1639623.1 glycosyltransferase [Pseudoclavibacter terrae]
MTPWIHWPLLVLGTIILVLGALKLIYLPLAAGFELAGWHRRRRRRRRHVATTIFGDRAPFVSVVVPAFNEANVLENCVRSLMRSRYPAFEVILVDDGSTDSTFSRMQELAAEHPGVTALTKANGGKGSALNVGIRASRGEVLLLSDADGVFGQDALATMVDAFTDTSVGAVCGDDRPVNLDRVQTRFLAVISHVGTGLVRRAMHVLRCLPIVSGNIGAFRRDVLERSGLLAEDTLGEDLELTWRIYRAGYRVAFAPTAVVYAESPSTLKGLWRQRVRWGRGLLQTCRRHADMIGNPRYRAFGLSLLYLVGTSIVVPIAQLMIVPLLIIALILGDSSAVAADVWQFVLWLGLPVAVLFLLVALALNRAWGDLRFAWTLLFWPAYSALMSLVFVRALSLELRKAPQRWNKLERTGVVSRTGTELELAGLSLSAS